MTLNNKPKKPVAKWEEVQIVRAADIARHYNVTEGLVRKWEKKETFPKAVYKVPGAKASGFYLKRDIEEFFKAHDIKSGKVPFCSRIQAQIKELEKRVLALETEMKGRA